MSPLKDQYFLYKASVRKDPEAFARLYDLHVKQIYRFIFFKVGCKEDAEDLTANVFLKAWEYLNEGKKEIRNFRAFVYELARNRVIDFYRQNGRQESLFFDQEEESTPAGAIWDFAADQMIDDDKKTIIKALDKLKSDYKEVIILRYIEDLSYREISQILKKSQIATRVLLHRAMKALRDVIASEAKQSHLLS